MGNHQGRDGDDIKLMCYPIAVVLMPDKVVIIEHNGEVIERALEAPFEIMRPLSADEMRELRSQEEEYMRQRQADAELEHEPEPPF